MTSGKSRIHLISGHSLHRDGRPIGGPTDQGQLLKYTIFYLVVAAILVLTNRAAKGPIPDIDQPQSSNFNLDLSVRKLEPNRRARNAVGQGAYIVGFHLANQGNQPIFYPVSLITNRPVGHVVYRASLGSDWRLVSQPVLSASGAAELNSNGNIAWIEMPPGGGVDGEYDDVGFSFGEHAYEMDVKFELNGKVRSLFSNPYCGMAH